MTLLITEAFSDLAIFDESLAYAETKIIPSITASERYDSNVWFAPSDLIPPGSKPWDFVTAVSPQVQVDNKNRQANTSLIAGVSANAFVNNTEFAYISTNAVVSSDLSGWIGGLIRGAKLQVSDAFLFTPEPPAFLTGVRPSGTSDAFSRGIVGSRANTFVNTASVFGDYALSRRIGLTGNYNFSIFRIGQTFLTQIQPGQPNLFPIAYFNTSSHSFSVGPKYRLMRGDTVGLDFQGTFGNFEGTGTSQNFAARGLVAEYTKVTPDWTVTINGGPMVIDPGSDVFLGGRVDFTKPYDPSTAIRLSVSRQPAPAFFGTGGALISNVAVAAMERKLSKVLTLKINASYAYNVAAPVEVIRYETGIGSVQLSYKVTRTLVASVSYAYNYYNYTQPGIPPPLGQFLFDRNVVTFSIASTWK